MDYILNIDQGAEFDERIVKVETHTHLPYASSKYGPSDEIRIPFQQTDTYVWPAGSYLVMEGVLPSYKEYTLVNNCLAFSLSEIQLHINSTEIDSVRQPGITTTLKGYASFSKDTANRLQTAGWKNPSELSPVVDPQSGHFEVCAPLSTLLGYCEDYSKILMNVRMELVLVRANKDDNMLIPADPTTPPIEQSPKVEIQNISWRIPYISLSDREKLKMLGHLERNIPIEQPFRSWSLFTYPTLPSTTNHVWTIKTATQLEKPRFVIFGLQTARNGNVKKDCSVFDNCGLKSAKLVIGSSVYPYGNLNLNFSKRALTRLYEMYVNFQFSYYGREVPTPMFSYEDFIKTAPIVIIDCSRQTEQTIGSTMDVRLEFETRQNVPPDTTAYCLILHDQLVTQYPLSGIITKGI